MELETPNAYNASIIAKSKWTVFFDSIDSLDRKMYGSQGKIFVLGAIFVLLIAPLLDKILGVTSDRITFISTVIFIFYTIVLILVFVSAWRDDDGNWTWERAKSRIGTYYATAKDLAFEAREKTTEDNLFSAGYYMIIVGLVWRAFENASVLIRKGLEKLFHTRFYKVRHWEQFTNTWSLVLILCGIVIIGYLVYKNPTIKEKIRAILKSIFPTSNGAQHKLSEALPQLRSDAQLVFNSRIDEHIQAVSSFNNSPLFQSFVSALQEWRPHEAQYEYQFQDRLYRHLRRRMPGVKIQLEYPIGEKSQWNNGRADVVIDDFILIEMKRSERADSIQRAKGQIQQYSEIWRERGPVVLLLCDFNYEKAHATFTPTMSLLAARSYPVMAIVAKPK